MKKSYPIIIFILLASISIPAQTKFGFSISGGSFTAVGDFNNFYNTTFGGSAGLIFMPYPTFQVSINSGFAKWEVDNEAFNNNFKEDGGEGEFDLAAPVQYIPLTLGVKWIFGNSKKYKPYAGLQVGIYFYESSLSGTYTKNSVVADIEPQDQKGNNTMLNLGGGVLFRIARNLFLDTQLNYNILSDNNSLRFNDDGSVDTSPLTANFISAQAGIQYHF